MTFFKRSTSEELIAALAFEQKLKRPKSAIPKVKVRHELRQNGRPKFRHRFQVGNRRKWNLGRRRKYLNFHGIGGRCIVKQASRLKPIEPQRKPLYSVKL